MTSLYAARRRRNRIMMRLSLAATLMGLAWLVVILTVLLWEGLSGLSLAVFTEMTPPPGGTGGLLNPIVGSLMLTILAVLIGTPIGILAGTYMAEYGRHDRLTSVVRFINDILLSAPSIVVGLFIYEVMVAPMGHFSGLAGAVALAVIVIPVVVRTTEDMLILVPNELREAAAALGTPRAFVITTVCYRVAHAPVNTSGLAEKLSIRNLEFYYGGSKALNGISLPLYQNRVTAFIGPSGCGKSTLLRVLNRMYDLYPNQRAEGEVLFDGDDILSPGQDLNLLRARIGMVFQKPTPFPMSIYENIAFGLRLYQKLPKSELDGRVETSLRRAALWEEVKDKLGANGLSLSGGQQQRLCIARTVAVKPEVILFDEPCSALDPISTAKIEELIDELKEHYTIVIVTHNMQQAARVSDFTAFMYLGELIEFDTTSKLFTAPSDRRTQD